MPRLQSHITEYLRFTANCLSLLNPSLRRCLAQTAWVISKTHETAAWVAKVDAESLVSLEIGINPERVANRLSEPIPGKLRCLYAGRLISIKGIHLALAAVALAYAKGVDITFTIIRDGPLACDLQNKASLLGIGQRVTFTGKMKQASLFAQYREHDLLLFPSLHDSSGNVVLESFANGLPVLCLNLGGPGEMVDDTCGRAIDAKDVGQETVITRLADSLIEFANSPELMKHFRDGARVKAIASSWDATVDRVYAPVEKFFYTEP